MAAPSITSVSETGNVLTLGHRTHPPVFSRLELLPNELLDYVVEDLPLDAGACLALSSRTLMRRVGTHRWKEITRLRKQWDHFLLNAGESWPPPNLPRPDEEAMNFFVLLQRDWPGTWYCDSCCFLHYGWSKRRPKDRCKRLSRHGEIFIDTPLLSHTFLEVQQTAAQLRRWDQRPRAAVPTLQQSVLDAQASRLQVVAAIDGPRRTDYGWPWPVTTVHQRLLAYDVATRLVHDRVIIRTQQWLEVLPNSRWTDSFMLELAEGCPCSHLSYVLNGEHELSIQTMSPELLSTGISHEPPRKLCLQAKCSGHWRSRRPKVTTEPQRWRCGYCPTEVQFDVHRLRGHHDALVVTCWRNLGEGRSRDDPVWLAQRVNGLNYMSPQVDLLMSEWYFDDTDVNQPAATFEEQPGKTLHELESELCGKAREVVQPREWYLGLISNALRGKEHQK